MERRIRRLGVFMILCFAALFVQLNNIQVLKANSLANDPKNPRVVAVSRSQSRGEILSSDGVKLASSVPAPMGTDYKYTRTYNPDTAVLFSQIVGYDSPIYGKSGIEAEYNSYLTSHTRPATSLRDLLVNRTSTDNVTLTIDSHLQLQVANILDNDVLGKPTVAAAVVIDPKTGAIEAMYSNPTYDPSPLASPYSNVETSAWKSLTTDPANPMLSRAYQRSYEPGSTFKVVTSSAIYDHKPDLATVSYPTDTQCIPLPQSNQILCNYGRNTPAGPEKCGGTIQTALPVSCDTSFAQYGMKLGAGPLYSEATAFGFNQRIPLDLPYVPASNFPTLAQLTNNKPMQAYSAFGQQDVSATTLQMALVAAAIANKGVIMTPHVMKEIRDSQGNLVTSYKPKPWLRATSPQTAASVTSLMQGVVAFGTASGGIFPASEDVAAKTGTAETGPNGSLTNDWMIAFAPANDPKVAVAVAVPNQPGSATGAATSGTPTQKILAAALAAAS